ncbi:hypothetical protein MRX96_031825 [Rhipicephalus microplus]
MDLATQDDQPPQYVQYHSSDASVQLVDADQALSQASLKVSRKRRCSSVKALTVALTVSLITTLAALMFLFLQPFELSLEAEQSKSVALPDVTNLSLVSANNHYLTLAWDQPKIKFDYYWLEVSGCNANENGSLEKRRPSFCGNGTIIRPEQNQVTCGPFNACSSVSVTIRTYARGPPELISAGTTISDLFIDSQEASEPRNIIMMPKSSTMTRLQWEEPTSLEGTLDVYKVKVCKSFITCEQKQSVSGCLEYEASHAWLDISSIPDTKYCVVITAITRCGRNFKTSLPSTQEIQTPLFALPDVSDLAVEGIKSGYVALSWQRPTGRFDYYSIQETLNDCIEQMVTETETVFDSKVDTLYCVLIATRTLCGSEEMISRQVKTEIRTPVFELPDVSNLTTVDVKNGYITLYWQRPQGRFDYYSIEVTGNSRSIGSQHMLGECANGTIIRPDQTTIRCGPFEPCTKLSCTMRTHMYGSPERASPGVTIKDIFIPYEELHAPRNITMVLTSTSRTQVRWEYPDKLATITVSHNVKICETSVVCGQMENFSSSKEHVTSESSLTFVSTQDTAYCVLVTAKARCGMNEISSSTAVAEIRTPIIVLPDVTSLRLISVGSNNFTAAWTKPKVNFDYYWIEVIGSNNDGTRVTLGTVGSCGDGTIIHRDLTHVTCTQLQPCSRVNFKVRTHINGPPARTSSGVSLYDILIPASVQPEVTNLKLGDVGTDTFALTWKRRSTCFDYYTVEVTDINSNRSSGVTCNNGTQISPIQTSVTCEQITTCSNVTIRVKTHTRGPPTTLWKRHRFETRPPPRKSAT